MATAGQLVDDVLLRARDPQAGGISRAQVRQLMDLVQLALCRHYGALIRDRPFTTQLSRLLYPIDTNQTIRLTDVYHDDRRLVSVTWQQLREPGYDWWRSFGELPQVWAPIGTNFIFIAPVSTTDTFDLVIREQVRPARLTSDFVDLDLPAEHHPRLLDLVEALILLRQRDPAVVEILAQATPEIPFGNTAV